MRNHGYLPRFELYAENDGKYRFKLVAPNGVTIATSRPYASRKACLKGIQSVSVNAPKARIIELGPTVSDKGQASLEKMSVSRAKSN